MLIQTNSISLLLGTTENHRVMQTVIFTYCRNSAVIFRVLCFTRMFTAIFNFHQIQITIFFCNFSTKETLGTNSPCFTVGHFTSLLLTQQFSMRVT